MTNQEQLPIAIKAMKDLGIDPDYICAFEREGKITQFIRYAGYFIDEHTECDLLNQIRLFEATYGAMVYAVTHERFEFGECFSFLYVSKYKEDNQHLVRDSKEGWYRVSAYVYNADCIDFSEFGSVGIQKAYGGIRRVF